MHRRRLNEQMFADGKRQANMKHLNTLPFMFNGFQSEKSELDQTQRFTTRELKSITFSTFFSIYCPYFGLLLQKKKNFSSAISTLSVVRC